MQASRPKLKRFRERLRPLLVGSALTLLTIYATHPPRLARAEAKNPFGAGDAPAPVDNFEDDDFIDPGNNLGFPGKGAPPPPPPSDASLPPPDTNSATPEPSRVSPSRPSTAFGNNNNSANTPGGRAARFGAPGGRPAQSPPPSSKNAKGGKKEPRLADYLELDPSVKGLEVKNFDLPDKDIKDVVTLISKWTGKNFILDSKVRGKITIIGPSQVTLQEAYQAFLSALEANGLTTVQSGKFIRIIESAEARRSPVKTYAGDYAPKDDQFITRVFQLKYINADEVQREFRDLTTRQGKLFAYEPTNSIIITDTGSNIQRIKELLETLDVKSFETTLHVLKVRNSSAKTISEMLGEIYGEGKGGAQGGQARTFRRSALERTRGGGIITKIIPDEQTNSLVVLANESGFISLQKLVAKLDVKVTDTGRIHVYYCEHAKAEDLAQTLASLAGGGSGGAKTNTSTRNTRVTTPPIGGGAPGAGGAQGGGAGGGSTGPVTAELEGGVKVTSDSATNSLVITANSSDYQTLKRVIRKLDIPRLQVFIETAVLEIQIGDTTKWGINSGILAGNRFGGGIITDQTTLLGILGGTPVGGATVPIFGPRFTAEIPGAGTQGATFLGILNMLATSSQTSVLSTPQILALDNEKAEFKVQDEIPVVSGFSTVAQGATNPLGNIGNTSIERKKTGIDIKLTPHVNAASRNIRLEIDQTVEDISSRQVPAQLKDFQVATSTRQTNTQVVVKDGDFVALGGMISDKVDESTQKVPLLGDIPILGWLFKSKNWTTTKTNLVILLHPRIIGTSKAASDVIKQQMLERDNFIEQHMGGDEAHPHHVDKLKAQLKGQEERSVDEKLYELKNTDEERDEENTNSRPRPQDEPQLGKTPVAPTQTAKKDPAPKAATTTTDDALMLGDPGTPAAAPPPVMPPPTEGSPQ